MTKYEKQLETKVQKLLEIIDLLLIYFPEYKQAIINNLLINEKYDELLDMLSR